MAASDSSKRAKGTGRRRLIPILGSLLLYVSAFLPWLWVESTTESAMTSRNLLDVWYVVLTNSDTGALGPAESRAVWVLVTLVLYSAAAVGSLIVLVTKKHHVPVGLFAVASGLIWAIGATASNHQLATMVMSTSAVSYGDSLAMLSGALFLYAASRPNQLAAQG